MTVEIFTSACVIASGVIFLVSNRESLRLTRSRDLKLSEGDKVLLNQIEADHLKRSAALLGTIDPEMRADIYELYPLIPTSTKGDAHHD
jgi:hypothetical protein